MQHDLLNSEELGLALGDSERPGTAARAVNIRILRGHPMPPSISIPHLSGRRWRRAVVESWLLQFEGPTRTKQQAARGGRPRKLDLLARNAQ